MKRTLIAAMVAALAIPVGFAAPASAYVIGNDLTLSVDNSKGTEPMSVSAQLSCGKGALALGYAVLNDVVPAGETRGEVPSCTLGASDDGEWTVVRDGLRCMGSIKNPFFGELKAEIYDRLSPNCSWSVITQGSTEYTPYFQWEKNNDGVYNLTVYSSERWQEISAPSTTVANAAGDVITANARAKNTNYVTRNPNRVTAMAKRFVDAPGSPINIHGYGPDRDVALARAEHVRDHLLAEITRLGGDLSTYPTFVTYAGNPDHKKSVHVTIHQHAASSITVPEGGALTIGGSS